jgi:hypothetical protein
LRSFAGINGEEWHIETIRMAMRMYDPGHILMKVPVVDGACSSLVHNSNTQDGTGKKALFFVDGTLAKTFMRVGRDFRAGGVPHTQYGFDDPTLQRDTMWRHEIAIKGDRMFCPGFPDNGVTLRNLWLDSTGKPRPDGYGYMKRLLRVWKVVKSRPGFVRIPDRTKDYVSLSRKKKRVN